MTDAPSRTIVVLDGDQTGQELLLEALRVLDPAVIRLPVAFVHFDLSLDSRRRTRNAVIQDAAEALRLHGLGLKAATITPEEPDDVSSPTFTLIHEFGDKPKVYHLDLYRIERAGQALALGIDDLLDQDAVLLVEWGERFPGLWPAGRVEVEMKWAGETAREITCRAMEAI